MLVDLLGGQSGSADQLGHFRVYQLIGPDDSELFFGLSHHHPVGHHQHQRARKAGGVDHPVGIGYKHIHFVEADRFPVYFGDLTYPAAGHGQNQEQGQNRYGPPGTEPSLNFFQ